MGKTVSFDSVKAEYTGLWASAKIKPQHRDEVLSVARKIHVNRPRYDAVSKATGVPWFVIGIIHAMECTAFPQFTQHLHNGDSLKRRTWQVPAGRPLGDPPFTWEDSAIDALTMPGKGFDKITDWSIERVAYCLELYNGWGYRLYHPEIHSPYLWSYTTNYASGKYIADGLWSSTAVSEQCGAMAILKGLLEIDAAAIDLSTGAAPAAWPKAGAPASQPPAPSVVNVAARSRSVWYGVLAIFTMVANAVQSVKDWLGDFIDAVFSIIPQAVSSSSEITSALQSFAGMVKADIGWIIGAVGVFAAVRFIWRHVDFKRGTLTETAP